MPWREIYVMEERLRFIARRLEGEGMSDRRAQGNGRAARKGHRPVHRRVHERDWPDESTGSQSDQKRPHHRHALLHHQVERYHRVPAITHEPTPNRRQPRDHLAAVFAIARPMWDYGLNDREGTVTLFDF